MTFADRSNWSFAFKLTAAALWLSCGMRYAQASGPAVNDPVNDPRIGSLIETLQKTRTPNSAAISPDGTTVAWALRGQEGATIHLTEVANPAEDKIISTGSNNSHCSSSEPKWSPDGESLAFVSDCTTASAKSDQEQVFLWSKKTGQSKAMTHLTGGIDSLSWSPDGKAIGFLFVENATRSAGALAAMKPWAGVIGEDGVEIQRVDTLDLATGTVNYLTPSNLHVYEFAWSPDSHQITFVAANPPGENNWWVAQLYTEDLVSRIDSTGAKTQSRDV